MAANSCTRFIFVAMAIGGLTTIVAAQVAFDEQPVQGLALTNDVGRGVVYEMDGVNGLDLVAPTATEDLIIGLNDGAGGYGSFVEVDVGSNNLIAADCGDFDNDGLMDVIAIGLGSTTHRIYYIRQISTGVWDDVESRVFAGVPISIVTRDFNNDGNLDFAVGDSADEDVEVFLGDGSGSLAVLSPISYPMGDCHAITAADLDADGDQDLIAIGRPMHALRVRFNTGGTFGAADEYNTGANPHDVRCGDVNADGIPDIIVPNKDDNTVTIFLNDGSGGLSPIAPIAAGANPVSVALHDFDCDGDLDIVVADDVSGTVGALTALLNDGDGGWTTVPSFASFTSVYLGHIVACEMDNQPGTDLVTFESAGPFSVTRSFFNIGSACGECIAPPAGIVAWYAGDLCTPEDLTGNNDGSYTGLPFCPADEKVGGGALGFSSGPMPTYITVDGECNLDPSDHDYSFSAWMRSRSPDSQPIASKGNVPGYIIGISTDSLRLINCNSTSCWNTSGSTIINDGDWHHVVFTIQYGPTTFLRIWVDGLLENTTAITAPGPLDSPHPLIIGGGFSPAPSTFLDGALDEVQIFSRALSVKEIQSMYYSGLAGQCRNICDPVVDVAEVDLYEETAGDDDDFAVPSEPTAPGAILVGSCTGSVDFDNTPTSGSVCHTFDALPDYIEGGTLEIVMRAGSGSACDDTISVQATGGVPEFLWSRRLGDPDSLPCPGDGGLLECTWQSPRTHRFCLDLNQLPNISGPATSVITNMNATNRLDVRIENNTAVDFIRLRLALDDCPGDIDGDGGIGVFDLFDLLSNWGPCPPPCPPCPYDVNNDCTVDVFDLFVLLGAWGPC